MPPPIFCLWKTPTRTCILRVRVIFTETEGNVTTDIGKCTYPTFLMCVCVVISRAMFAS